MLGINLLTKEAIETALLLLLKDKPLKKIAITELVDLADISRNSFYRNYQTKEGVLWGVLQDRLTKLASHNVEQYARDREAGLLVIMETFQQEKAFYQLLIKEGLEGQLEEAIYTYQPLAGSEPDRVSYYRNRLLEIDQQIAQLGQLKTFLSGLLESQSELVSQLAALQDQL